MNRFGWYCKGFKQERISIISLSILQVWWCFNFPAYIRLGNPWGAIVSTGLSIGGVILIFYLFCNAGRGSHIFGSVYRDNSSNYALLKQIERGVKIVLFGLIFFLIWYFDMYGMKTVYYVALYIYFILFWLLLYQAALRVSGTEQ